MEQYIENHANVAISHDICPDCFEAHVKLGIEQVKAQQQSPGFHALTAPPSATKASDEGAAPNKDRVAGG